MVKPGTAGTAGDGLNSLTYEQAEAELVELIGKLETGDVPLEDSLQMWERATLLRGVCAQLLTDARTRLSSSAANGATGAVAPDASLAAVPVRAEPDDDPWLTPLEAPEKAGFSDEPPF